MRFTLEQTKESLQYILSSSGFYYKEIDSSRFEDVYYNKEMDIKAIISSNYDGSNIVSLYSEGVLIGTFKSTESLKSGIQLEKRDIKINKIID